MTSIEIYDKTEKVTTTLCVEQISEKLPLKKWHPYINGPTIADAILDRLTANYSKIELKGKSLRKSA